MKQFSKYKYIVLGLSFLIYSISLFCEAFYIDRTDYDAWSFSLGLVAMGWLGMLFGSAGAFVWLANPILFIAWIATCIRERVAIGLGAVATTIALCFYLFVDEIITGENGAYSDITQYCLGYWLWLLSMIVFTVGLIFVYAKYYPKHNEG